MRATRADPYIVNSHTGRGKDRSLYIRMEWQTSRCLRSSMKEFLSAPVVAGHARSPKSASNSAVASRR